MHVCHIPHDVASLTDLPDTGSRVPDGRVRGVFTADCLHALIEGSHVVAETLVEVGDLSRSVTQRAGHPGRTGDVGEGDDGLARGWSQAGGRGHGLELHARTYWFVTYEQVVMDLHDDQTALGQRGTGGEWQDVLAVSGCPRAEPRHIEKLT